MMCLPINNTQFNHVFKKLFISNGLTLSYIKQLLTPSAFSMIYLYQQQLRFKIKSE